MSSQMQIEIVNVSVSTVPTAKGSYQVADIAYKNKSFQDKLEGKKVMSFTNKEVFTTLSNASFGDVLEITREKNDKGYWDWIAVNGSGAGLNEANPIVPQKGAGVSAPMPGKAATPSPKSNYETAEERAARQVLIVRQSSVSSAVDLAVANKIKDPQAVVEIAKVFEAYVFDKEVKPVAADPVQPEPPAGFFDDLPDDLPFQ